MEIVGNNNPKLIFAVRDNYSPATERQGGGEEVGAKELLVKFSNGFNSL